MAGYSKADRKNDDMIEIAYAIHDDSGSYYEYLGVSMVSVMENTREVLRFHVLCDDTLAASAKEKLTAMCKAYGQRICFHRVAPDERISVTELLKAGYNEGILYRLYLPELLSSVRRILYLDADILANGDVRKLWDVDVEAYAAAGRWDPPLLGFKPVEEPLRARCRPFRESTDWTKYVNSGVLVLNLERIRKEHHLWEEAVSFWNRYGMVLPDQDAVNYILRGKIRLLPPCCNMPNRDCPQQRKGIFYHYTYMGQERETLDPVDELYLSYWKKTPFYRAGYGKREKAAFLGGMKNRAGIYERLEKLGKLDREDVLNYGRCLYWKGEFQQAYAYLAGRGAQASAFPDYGGCAEREHVWEMDRAFLMAKSLREMKRTEEAIILLQESLYADGDCAFPEHDARSMEQWRFLGELYCETGRYEEAGEAFLHCLYFGTPEKNACALAALFCLVKCMLCMDRLSEAETYYTMLDTLAPLDNGVKLCGIRLERARRKKEAVLSGNSAGKLTTEGK